MRFHIYLDGGTADIPGHIMQAVVTGKAGRILATWNGQALAALPRDAIHNVFAYNKVTTGPYGLVARMGAKATITLPPDAGADLASRQSTALTLTSVDGDRFSLALSDGRGRR